MVGVMNLGTEKAIKSRLLKVGLLGENIDGGWTTLVDDKRNVIVSREYSYFIVKKENEDWNDNFVKLVENAMKGWEHILVYCDRDDIDGVTIDRQYERIFMWINTSKWSNLHFRLLLVSNCFDNVSEDPSSDLWLDYLQEDVTFTKNVSVYKQASERLGLLVGKVTSQVAEKSKSFVELIEEHGDHLLAMSQLMRDGTYPNSIPSMWDESTYHELAVLVSIVYRKFEVGKTVIVLTQFESEVKGSRAYTDITT